MSNATGQDADALQFLSGEVLLLRAPGIGYVLTSAEKRGGSPSLSIDTSEVQMTIRESPAGRVI